MADLLAFRAMSDIINRLRFAGKAGLSFQGKRDMYSALGYDTDLTVQKMRARYRRGGIVKRIVNAHPQATWRGGAEVVEVDDPEVTTDFEAAWQDLNDRLHFWAELQRTDTLAGQGRYACLLLGCPGEMNTPAKKGELAYIHPYGEDEMKVLTVESDAKNERFGQPAMYQLTRETRGVEGRGITRDIHWTRVLHITHDPLDDRIYGNPVLEAIWNYMDDLDKCVGGGSEAFWRRVHMGYFFSVDPAAKIDDADLLQMKEQAETFAHDLRRTMAMKGTEVTALGSDVASFEPQVNSILSLIAGTTGIPQRILIGSERGELASGQDKENWDTRIDDRRNDFAEPFVIRPLIQRLVELEVLPEVEEYTIIWPTVEDETELDRARIADIQAGLNKKNGGIIILDKEIRNTTLGLDPLTDEEIAAEEERAQQKAAAAMQAMQQGPGGAPPAPGSPASSEEDDEEEEEDDEQQGPPQRRAASSSLPFVRRRLRRRRARFSALRTGRGADSPAFSSKPDGKGSAS